MRLVIPSIIFGWIGLTIVGATSVSTFDRLMGIAGATASSLSSTVVSTAHAAQSRYQR